eukprot:TRINITY_DN8661_c0_g1_i1.p1 TRINITY_DN8661_c0_g1~~TRINITY_DN8661_c0_g1_i1.p1  ORF type:complete len:503 (+),score=58.60 TRINITY_DN8661_c0_g1_i1:919-2427(+)
MVRPTQEAHTLKVAKAVERAKLACDELNLTLSHHSAELRQKTSLLQKDVDTFLGKARRTVSGAKDGIEMHCRLSLGKLEEASKMLPPVIDEIKTTFSKFNAPSLPRLAASPEVASLSRSSSVNDRSSTPASRFPFQPPLSVPSSSSPSPSSSPPFAPSTQSSSPWFLLPTDEIYPPSKRKHRHAHYATDPIYTASSHNLNARTNPPVTFSASPMSKPSVGSPSSSPTSLDSRSQSTMDPRPLPTAPFPTSTTPLLSPSSEPTYPPTFVDYSREGDNRYLSLEESWSPASCTSRTGAPYPSPNIVWSSAPSDGYHPPPPPPSHSPPSHWGPPSHRLPYPAALYSAPSSLPSSSFPTPLPSPSSSSPPAILEAASPSSSDATKRFSAEVGREEETSHISLDSVRESVIKAQRFMALVSRFGLPQTSWINKMPYHEPRPEILARGCHSWPQEENGPAFASEADRRAFVRRSRKKRPFLLGTPPTWSFMVCNVALLAFLIINPRFP